MGSLASQPSPRMYGRIAGVLYLIIIVAGGFAELYVRSKLIVSGDPTATATKIVDSQLLWRIAFASELVMLVCDVAVALILYVLLRPVDRNLALLAAFFRLMHVGIYGITGITNLAVLHILSGAGYLTVFQPQQLHALAYLVLKLHGEGYAIALVFFGFHCLVLGYLIFKSGYFPRILGALLMIAALSYLIDSFAGFLVPPLEAMIFPGILLVPFVAEASLGIYLTVKGVNLEEWKETVMEK